MRFLRFRDALAITTYVVLLIAVVYVVPAGPRVATSLSVAADGSFTVSSWIDGFNHDQAIHHWSADLSERRRVPIADPVAPGAHAITLNSNAVGFCSRKSGDQQVYFVVVDIETGQLIRKVALPKRNEVHYWSEGNVFAFHATLSDELTTALVMPSHDAACVVDLENGTAESFPTVLMNSRRSVRHITSDPQHKVFVAESLVVLDPETESYGTAISVLTIVDGKINLIFDQEYRTSEVDEVFAAVNSAGTLAIQRNETVTLIPRDVEPFDIEHVFERGVVNGFDRTGTRLLLKHQNAVSVFDLGQGRELARREYGGPLEILRLKVQDSQHLLFVDHERADLRQRIVRWNWRTGETTSRDVGGVRASATNLQRWSLFAGFLAWLLAVALLGRRQSSAVRPTLSGVALIVFVTIAAWSHPQFRYSDWFEAETLPAMMLVTTWSAAVCLASCWLVFGSGRLPNRLPLFVLMLAAAAYFLYHSTITGNWLAVITAIESMALIVAIGYWWRRRALGVTRAGIDGVQNASSARTFSLRDLVLFIFAAAVVFGVCSTFQAPYIRLKEVGFWSIYAIEVSIGGCVAFWSALSISPRWKRHAIWLSITGLSALVVYISFDGHQMTTGAGPQFGAAYVVLTIGVVRLWSWFYRLHGFRLDSAG